MDVLSHVVVETPDAAAQQGSRPAAGTSPADVVADARSASSGTRTLPPRGVKAVKTYREEPEEEPEEDDENLELEEGDPTWEKQTKKRRLKASAPVSLKRAQADVSIGFAGNFMVLQETGVKGEEGGPAPASRNR